MVTFDKDSVAGQRVAVVQRTRAWVLWNLYGTTAFSIVTDDASAIGLGLVALRSGRSGAEVARGLTEYLQAQEARKAKAAEEAAQALRDKRNAAARARRRKKKENPDG